MPKTSEAASLLSHLHFHALDLPHLPPRSCCLSSLQPLAELQEALCLLAGAEKLIESRGAASDAVSEVLNQLTHMVDSWQGRWPVSSKSHGGISLGDPGALLGVLSSRLLVLRLISQMSTQWGSSAVNKAHSIGKLFPPLSSSSLYQSEVPPERTEHAGAEMNMWGQKPGGLVET